MPLIPQGKPPVRRRPSELADGGLRLCLTLASQPQAPLTLAWVETMDADRQPCPWAQSWGDWLAEVLAGRWSEAQAEQARLDDEWGKEPPLPF